MTTDTTLSILLVEDNPGHAEAIRRALAASGEKAVVQVAGTLREYREAVAAHPPDIALVDLVLPDGRALEALIFPPEAGPFPILVMTSLGNERTAVAAIKAGALDYIVKSPEAFAAMPRIVSRALHEWNLIQKRKGAEDNFRRSLDDSPLGVHIVSAEGETLYANRALLDIYGYDSVEELRSTPIRKRYTPQSYAEFKVRDEKRRREQAAVAEYEVNIVRKSGELRNLHVLRKETLWNGKIQYQAIYRDTTDHKLSEEKLKKTIIELEKAFGGIIQVLSAAVEKRDPYTAGHEKRVAALAREIGLEMGLDDDRLNALSMAGAIHDVGKISIPAEILSKPGQLAAFEYKLIQAHPQMGYDILKDIDFPWPIADIILQHHERMNGSGYPFGLKGQEILVEARILAVADVVEAMASHRPYRPALGIDAALKEIEKHRGIFYDSDVVAACLRLFKQKGFSFEQKTKRFVRAERNNHSVSQG